MALNKQDYYKQGADHFADQLEKGIDVSVESIDYMGDSWQAKAFREGFSDARLVFQGSQAVRDFAANGDPSMGIPPSGGFIKGEMVVMTAKTGAGKSKLIDVFKSEIRQQTAQETAMCHIQNLALIAANLGDHSKRAQRIWAKIQKLTNKWGF